ncbi:hypothetical protein J2X19_002184 [Rhodoferax ferrireducens]|uniref:Uncharacterized protein n=1 Tax=Rhodoferax ferrireducens TaxID=192843 RepID=A0ABU2C844_9BURK|nr:hypothetical protein [Rhodoferax ferrireducens]MDR7377505.1 hypothetical protein [Rhodoferax ferrireducens]
MEISPVSRQYSQTLTQTTQTDESQQAQNRAVRQQQEAAAKKLEQTKPAPVVNGQGQTIGGLLNTTA